MKMSFRLSYSNSTTNLIMVHIYIHIHYKINQIVFAKEWIIR